MAKIADIDPLLTEENVSPLKQAFTPEKATSYLGSLWAETIKELRHDLKATRWRHTTAAYFTWLFFSIWAVALFILCVIFPIVIIPEVTQESSDYWNYCAPDGSFSLEPTNPWNLDWTFQIVLAFGSLTFTQAKVVDVVWDIGVGRLGQSLLAYFSWKAFSVYVRASMETTPITYQTFWTTFMRNDVSFASIFRLIRDFARRRGLRSKLAMAFMTTTMLFIVVFPTLASAMTGYTANNDAVIKLENGSTQVPFEKFRRLVATIHDGNRVNLTAEYNVFRGAPQSQSQTCGYGDCISEYMSKYGSNNHTSSIWYQGDYDNPKTLESPTLNITYWADKESDTLFLYTPNNTTYTIQVIQENAVCQPVMVNLQQTYQWGFSVVQLEIAMILLTIWTFGVWIMWLHAHLELSNRGKYEVPRELKAALYLADSIRSDLKEFDQEAEFLSNKELKAHAAEHLKGGKVDIQALSLVNGYSFRRSSWKWIKTNKLWAFVFFFVLASTYFLFGIPLFLTMSFAMAAGWGRRTRAVMSWGAFLLVVAVGLPVYMLTTAR
ncbi:hypothetical protein J7T55_010817 [Diaporthe amygdali]|uniref:uncharacterized protein n=1 Tax=Phomopsis amygdali TaxID=1214568 RepID=UPI0022FDF70D|nr:uncharacterized protein J7T55_010817 [Diaporthe amygdali]KAJ0114428.1 hypothetical protein J7T55_010817 [Diaporthe amygdali]